MALDDASDLRTRLIYASLRDDDLVRQLQEGQRTRRRRSTAASVAGGGSTRGPAPARGSRPWPVPVARDVIDLTDAPQTNEGTAGGTTVPTGVAARVPRPSEWSVDDPSYYLG